LEFYDREVPAYAALAEHLRDQIITGQYQPGERIPSAAELVRTLEVSREVAEGALATLKAEGWTQAYRGRGTRVRRRPESVVRDMTRPDPEVLAVCARLAEQGSPVDDVIESVKTAIPTPEQVAGLGIPAGLPVILIRREYWSGGDLAEWTEQVLPGESVELRYRLQTGPDQR
jgi:DNA-binding GntR family transcriptional regulator